MEVRLIEMKLLWTFDIYLPVKKIGTGTVRSRISCGTSDPYNYLVEIGVHLLFIVVRTLSKPVMIRRLDFRVNSSQILFIGFIRTISVMLEYHCS